MRRSLRTTFITLLLALTPGVYAQTPMSSTAANFTGQWQGSTTANTPMRILLRFEPAGNGPITGVVYLLDGDNAAWPHATSALTIQGSEVSFRIVNLDVSFTGRLTQDGTLAGIWKQRGADASLGLAHVTGDAAWPIPHEDVRSMPVTADPAFDVATIKPADPKDTGRGFQTRGVRIIARNESLEDIFAFAYSVHRGQIQGAPAWFATEHWQIDGIPDVPGSPNLAQMRTMYRKLLTERFGLQVHEEKRDLPVYLLETVKEGPKLTRSLGDPNGPPDSTGNQNRGVNDVRYTDMSMDEFVQDLAFSEDRPVVNGTALTGRYDFRLRWASADAAAASENAGTDAPPVLFTAIREQLGLTLKATRTQVPVLVIAHVERPSAN